MSTPTIPDSGSPIARNHHNKRELNSGKLVGTQLLSSDFLSRYVEWRNSRIAALPPNRMCDRWYQAMMKENVWHQWFLVGTVESETMLSRSVLAHIFDNVKARASPSIRSAKRGLLFLHRNARSHFKFRYCIILCELISFSLCICAAAAAAGGRRDNPSAMTVKTEKTI